MELMNEAFCIKILIEERLLNYTYALIQIGSILMKFVMCHTHNRHATEMTKIWLK